MKPYPLQFQPEFKERIWGGRTLEKFGLHVPPGRIGESWIMSDHPHGETRVQNGPLKGLGLNQLFRQFGKEWFERLGKGKGSLSFAYQAFRL